MRILSVCLLFLTAACASAGRHPVSHPPTGTNNEVVATVLGTTYHDADFYKPGDRRNKRMEISVNRLRPVAARALVKTAIPTCRIDPNSDEIREFIGWWAAAWTEMRDNYMARKGSAGVKLPDAGGISLQNEAAVAYAKEQVGEWLLFRCIQNAHGGDRFQRPLGLERFMKEPGEMILSVRALSADLMVPLSYKATPMPLSALGRLFRQAEQEGKLAFQSDERREYFFARYAGPETANVSADEATAALQTPYWRAGE